jgi:hypothetical protein
MKQAFCSYPEIPFIDATYKLIEIGLPTSLMLSEDSNSQRKYVVDKEYI